MAEPEAKPEPKEVEEIAEPPLIYKTWILKVSIHCEACKRKVKRVLKDVEGVYETDIDLKQQKVVVKGNVESETLIKKLLKTGKHAELWPEKSDSKGKKKGKSKKKEKQSDSESSGNEDEKEKVKFEVQVTDPTKNGEAAGKINDDGGQAKQPETSTTGGGQTSGGGKKKKNESHYATPQQYSYAYVHPGVQTEFDPPPSDYEPYLSQPSGSLEIFSDENPNGCSVV
ncbi:heavy metal-associated isoprenylated plant protein 36-like [Momordica charantia]|uniref:Heavy metal-associated isoprenylated plant protein 36-like n=1 Tax=Momordica charantia TaxID=3673 RepID=A0A6J1DAA1_MOMCH|nr:heavy metal-associated isoprenylated plant protein 36-like [Momordica charantia]